MSRREVKAGVIGAEGRMGKWLCRVLSSAGLQVAPGDVINNSVTPDLVASSDILIMAVPITTIDTVMRSIGPYTNPDGVVIDIASVKEKPLKDSSDRCTRRRS